MVDAEHLVHAGHCTAVGEKPVPYTTGTKDMHAWLARPDLRDSHAGPAVIRPCPLCIEVPSDRHL